jgi:hypothetical protein
MALNPQQTQQAIDTYGPMAQIINSVPALQQLMQEAVGQQWSQNQFQAKVMASPWYQQHSDTLRNLIMTQAADPAAYRQQLQNAVRQVSQTAAAMGRNMSQQAMQNMAYQYLAEGWNTQSLQDTIGWTANATQEAGGNGAYAGQAGQIQTHLEQVARSYGVPYTDQYIADWTTRIQRGQDSTDGFDAQMRGRAKMQYPQFAAQLDAGATMTQIADPYMAQMAKTLEVPQTSVTLQDPYIQKALSQRDPKSGAVTSQPMYAFEQTLKADPRYDNTAQAKTDAYSTLAQIGKDLGLSGGTTGAAA